MNKQSTRYELIGSDNDDADSTNTNRPQNRIARFAETSLGSYFNSNNNADADSSTSFINNLTQTPRSYHQQQYQASPPKSIFPAANGSFSKRQCHSALDYRQHQRISSPPVNYFTNGGGFGNRRGLASPHASSSINAPSPVLLHHKHQQQNHTTNPQKHKLAQASDPRFPIGGSVGRLVLMLAVFLGLFGVDILNFTVELHELRFALPKASLLVHVQLSPQHCLWPGKYDWPVPTHNGNGGVVVWCIDSTGTTTTTTESSDDDKAMVHWETRPNFLSVIQTRSSNAVDISKVLEAIKEIKVQLALQDKNRLDKFTSLLVISRAATWSLGLSNGEESAIKADIDDEITFIRNLLMPAISSLEQEKNSTTMYRFHYRNHYDIAQIVTDTIARFIRI